MLTNLKESAEEDRPVVWTQQLFCIHQIKIRLSCIYDAQIRNLLTEINLNLSLFQSSNWLSHQNWEIIGSLFSSMLSNRNYTFNAAHSRDAQRCGNNASAMPKLQCLLSRLPQVCFNLVPSSFSSFIWRIHHLQQHKHTARDEMAKRGQDFGHSKG